MLYFTTILSSHFLFNICYSTYISLWAQKWYPRYTKFYFNRRFFGYWFKNCYQHCRYCHELQWKFAECHDNNMGCCYEIDINLFFISTLTLCFDEPILIISVNIRIAAIDHNLLPRNESIDVIIEVSNEFYMTILDNVNILMFAGLWTPCPGTIGTMILGWETWIIDMLCYLHVVYSSTIEFRIQLCLSI